eukprot:SAG22_NODE_17732_length_299_cov_1.040000_1_plen_27_part_10
MQRRCGSPMTEPERANLKEREEEEETF